MSLNVGACFYWGRSLKRVTGSILVPPCARKARSSRRPRGCRCRAGRREGQGLPGERACATWAQQPREGGKGVDGEDDDFAGGPLPYPPFRARLHGAGHLRQTANSSPTGVAAEAAAPNATHLLASKSYSLHVFMVSTYQRRPKRALTASPPSRWFRSD